MEIQIEEKKLNQKELILQYIKDFGSITSYQAYIDLGITQLATRINTEWISKKNRYGKPVAFKKYKLEVTND